jgi:mono/diheme cytochrome c family protein
MATAVSGQANSTPAKDIGSAIVRAVAFVVAIAAFVMPVASNGEQDSESADAIEAGWRTIRQFDCARCHGGNFEGSAGPSLVEAARSRTREEFLRGLLDGNPERGMPPYRSVPRVAENAAAIYAYFKARADGLPVPGAR